VSYSKQLQHSYIYFILRILYFPSVLFI